MSAIQNKLDRLSAGLAPEDETLEQACHTAWLRHDDEYVARWQAHQARTLLGNPGQYETDEEVVFAAIVELVKVYTRDLEGDTLHGTIQAILENLED